MGRRKKSARAAADATARAAALAVAGVVDPDGPAAPDFEFEVDPVIEAARERLERRRSANVPLWHSLTPRLLVLLSIIGMLAAPLAFLLVFGIDEGAIDPQTSRLSDDELRQWQAIGATLSVAIVGAWLGAVWWAVAAAKNARRVSPTGPSPVTPVMLYVVFPAGAYLGMYLSHSRTLDLTLYYGCIGLVCLGYLVLTLGFRNAARKIGAPAGPWTALAAMPFLVLGANLALTLGAQVNAFSGDEIEPLVAFAVVGGDALALGGYIVSMGRAMATFDRACRSPRGPRDPAKEEALMNNLLAFHQRSLGIASEDMLLPQPVS
jgi:hypothetical protein